MPKYRLRETRFVQLPGEPGLLHKVEPGMPESAYPVIDLPDTYPVGRNMEPLDDSARALVKAWEADTAARDKRHAAIAAKRLLATPI